MNLSDRVAFHRQKAVEPDAIAGQRGAAAQDGIPCAVAEPHAFAEPGAIPCAAAEPHAFAEPGAIQLPDGQPEPNAVAQPAQNAIAQPEPGEIAMPEKDGTPWPALIQSPVWIQCETAARRLLKALPSVLHDSPAERAPEPS
jgi:hypothetical protein